MKSFYPISAKSHTNNQKRTTCFLFYNKMPRMYKSFSRHFMDDPDINPNF